MQPPTQLFLNTRQAKHFDGRHPWVLARSVIEPTVGLEAGQIVDLLQSNGAWIGRGIYNPSSRIRVRLYQWQQADTLDADWLCQRLHSAVAMRGAWSAANGQLDAVRLINSEGDGLSGLVVDRFGDYLIVQVTALAMWHWLDTILAWLQEHVAPKAICVRVDATTATNEGLPEIDEWRFGEQPTEAIELNENQVKLRIELSGGQKTGYYLDQRDNRKLAAKWVSEGPLLDVCCYQGGFSLAAKRWGQPTEILAVDSSLKALERAQENAVANGFDGIEFMQADCFDYLEKEASQHATYQTVILDPPRMASNRTQINAALRAYHRLNLSAVNALRPGGILITCSCSGRVKRSDFLGVLSSVAKRSRRRIQVLQTLGAAFDHPIDVNCPESEYLKCLICRVD